MSVTPPAVSSNYSNQEREVGLVVRTIGGLAWPSSGWGTVLSPGLVFPTAAQPLQRAIKREVQLGAAKQSPGTSLRVSISQTKPDTKMKVAILLLSVVVLSQAESWVAAPYTLVKRGITLAINVVDICLLHTPQSCTKCHDYETLPIQVSNNLISMCFHFSCPARAAERRLEARHQVRVRPPQQQQQRPEHQVLHRQPGHRRGGGGRRGRGRRAVRRQLAV